jgi:phage baseplate assembly protein W
MAHAGHSRPDPRLTGDSADEHRHLLEPGADPAGVTSYNRDADPGDGLVIDIDYPFHFDDKGRTATASELDHIRDMVEQVLFTAPGERVNRPDFGSGLLQLVFAPNNSELASAVQFTVQASLQQWLSDLIEVQAVESEADGSMLRVVVRYLVLSSGETRSETFERVGLT